MQYTCGVVEGLSYHLHVRRPWCFLPIYASHCCFTVHAMGRVWRSKGNYTKLSLLLPSLVFWEWNSGAQAKPSYCTRYSSVCLDYTQTDQQTDR